MLVTTGSIAANSARPDARRFPGTPSCERTDKPPAIEPLSFDRRSTFGGLGKDCICQPRQVGVSEGHSSPLLFLASSSSKRAEAGGVANDGAAGPSARRY